MHPQSSFLTFLRACRSDALPRGFALFLGGFGVLNVLGGLRHVGFDATLWWLDLRWFPAALSALIVMVTTVPLIAFGISPPRSAWRRWLTVLCAGSLLIVTLGNSLNFYLLLARKEIWSAIPIPFSLLIAGALACVLRATVKSKPPQSEENLVRAFNTGEFGRTGLSALRSAARSSCAPLAVSCACLVLFPLLQMFCFGKTNYERIAEVTVVPGARVYRDGRPSDALADRVRTACQLYQRGLTKKLLFSGGPGDGIVHETEAMKRMAIRLGVKPEDILLDENGVNTQATVKNTMRVLSGLRGSRILVVSHFYHLPRIKLAYQREGLEVYTVPAKESYLLGQLPYNMAREVAALWVYYLRPLNV